MQQLIKTSLIAWKKFIEDRTSIAARTGYWSSTLRGFKNLGRHNAAKLIYLRGQYVSKVMLSGWPMLQYLMMMRLKALFVLHTAHTGMSKQRPHSLMLLCLLLNSAILSKVCERVAKLLSKARCASTDLSRTPISKRAGYAMLLVRRCANVLSLDAGSKRG